MEQRFQTQEELQKPETINSESSETPLPAASLSTPTGKQENASLTGKQLDPAVVNDLMRQLARKEGSASDPRWMLPDEQEALLEQLTCQARTQKRWRRNSRLVYGSGVALFIAFSIAFLADPVKYSGTVPLGLVFCYMITFFIMKTAELRWGQAATGMTFFDDLRAVGPLIEVLPLDNQIVVADAEKALTRLLPCLQASDADLLTAAQRDCLYRRLKIQYVEQSAEFMIAALKALEQIGDAKALPSVEALAEHSSNTVREIRVGEAAQHCLGFLKAQAEQKQSRDSLLRASSGFDTSAESLLRPTTESLPTDPRYLLRGSEPFE